jgi:aspartate/methionine/tyrosine aminotransferase
LNHPSAYLEWYVGIPHVKYDFRSSGTSNFKYDVILSSADLSANYVHGNPETAKLLAQRYNVKSESVFVSGTGASGQNARIVKFLAGINSKKNEAVVEYPTYEPLLRQVQEHFPNVKRLKRKESEAYSVDVDDLRKIASPKTGLVTITNPHAPSGAISGKSDLKEIMDVAHEYGFYVLCDEIYAEFDQNVVTSIFSIDSELSIVTTSFSKAYGLGGLKIGIALAEKSLVDGLYADVLSKEGTSPNIVNLVTIELLTKGKESLEKHKQKWTALKNETEKLLNEHGLEFSPNKASITYWTKLPVKDTYKWTNEHTIPRYSLAPVPGAFFLFKDNYSLERSDRIRLGLGNVNPDEPLLEEAFETLEKAIGTC